MKHFFLPFSIIFFLLIGTTYVYSQTLENQDYYLLTTNPEAFRAFLVANPAHIVNLKKADLSGLDMSNMQLKNADLSYANLSNTNFKESDLTGANLMGSKLINADFGRCNLSYANFDKTNATGAKFVNSTFKNTIMDYLMIQDGHQLNPAYVNSEGNVKPKVK